jgi:hypothetical protein
VKTDANSFTPSTGVPSTARRTWELAPSIRKMCRASPNTFTFDEGLVRTHSFWPLDGSTATSPSRVTRQA